MKKLLIKIAFFRHVTRKKIIQLWFKLTLYPRFGSFGKKSGINKPMVLSGSENIYVGNNVGIGYLIWMSAKKVKNRAKPSLVIEDGCKIGNFNHIFSTNSILIKRNVLTADKVYISDNLHSYEDITSPVLKQPIKQLNQVVIEEGVWLGENVCVIGACIGKGSVVGANSVVTKDIPEYCIAVGSPAKIIKRYNPITQIWEKTNPDGSFMI